jgi:tetratricopeptide (TPR) repeat protein
MAEWLGRYRDTGAALVALNPAEPRWQEELAWGHHNLAVVDLERGNLDAARRGFLGELTMLKDLSAAKPADLPLQFRIVDANSWLGTIAERSGDLSEAAARFTEEVSRVEAIAHAEPDNVKWRAKLADALTLRASILAVTGQRPTALELRVRAQGLLDGLVAGDPKNRTWLRASSYNRCQQAWLLSVEGDWVKYRALADEVRAGLEKLSAAEPTNREVTGRLAVAWRLWAEALSAAGDPGAGEAAARAIEIGETIVAEGRAIEGVVAEAAQTRVAAGQIAARLGDREAAQRHWHRALELLKARWAESDYWRVLDPAARAFALLGETERHRAIVARLDRMNYRPVEPWPVTGPR